VGSALDAATVAEGRSVGTGTAWGRTIDGRILNFDRSSDGVFRDRETGSNWTLEGSATSGPLAGQQLAAIDSLTSFWFAWASFEGADLYAP
jgi:hypothetical protein